MLTLLAAVLLQPTTTPAPTLHPVITEVLYAVPRDGDADQDGKRSATGDEFIELINPHDKAINLKGYTLSDARTGTFSSNRSNKSTKGQGSKSRTAPAKDAPKGTNPTDDAKPDSKPAPASAQGEHSIHFTFPDLILQPGEIVVVFNGYESHPAGPVGDKDKAAIKNPKFNDAYIFSMKTTSQYTALANVADSVLLSDPEGKPIECLWWGEERKPETAPKLHKLPESRGSVQRTAITGEFVRHQDLPGADADKVFSPGFFPLKKK